MDILALLQCLHPAVTKTTLRQMPPDFVVKCQAIDIGDVIF